MTEDLTIAPINGQARLVFRTAAPAAAREFLDFPVPHKIGETSRHGDFLTLCLGPDEWMIYAPDTQKLGLEQHIANLSVPHSLVDVSHGFEGLNVQGVGAIDALHMGCPLNLADVSNDWGVRSVFDHIGIIVLRFDRAFFRLEFARSYSAYMIARLQDAQRELLAETHDV